MFNTAVLSDNIKKQRKIKKLTQKDLADMIKVSPQAISKWECGLSVPDIENLYDLSSILGISIDTLIGKNTYNSRTMIAIDGGGSKTEFVLFDESGRILNRILLGGCNPNICGIKETTEILKSGIDILLGQSPNPLGMYIGCAGFGSGNNAYEIKERLRQYYPHIKISCKSDIYNVSASATDEEKCIAAICGTGIVVYVADSSLVKQYDGWGYLLDNGGSGFSIGRDVLRTALMEREGRKEKSLITPLCESKLGGNVYDKFTDIYTRDIGYIASFAPIAFEAYKNGDKLAEKILEKNSDVFAELINHAAKQYKDYNTVVISGSIITKSEIYLNLLKKKTNKKLKLVIPTHPQIFGACVKCAQMCGIPLDKLKKNFMKYYTQGEF